MLSRLCETMQWPRNSSLIAYKNFHNFHRIRPFFVDDRRYNGGCCLHVQAHNQISLNCLYTSFPTRIGGLSACIGNVVHSTYTTGTRALLDIYACALRAVHIYLAKHLSLWYKYNVNLILDTYSFDCGFCTLKSSWPLIHFRVILGAWPLTNGLTLVAARPTATAKWHLNVTRWCGPANVKKEISLTTIVGS